MVEEIIINNAVVRDKKYNYRIDKHGNLVRSKYNYFKDPYTFVVLLILITAFVYINDVKTAREYVNSPCVKQCLVIQWVNQYRALNPSVQLDCNYETASCKFFGVEDVFQIDPNLRDELNKINITIDVSK